MYANSGFVLLKSFCLYHFFISGSFKIPAYLDAPFKSNGKCPVVIFSHGLGAFRYSIWTHLQHLLITKWKFCSSATTDAVIDMSLVFPQDFVFRYMCRIGFSGLHCGVRGTQVCAQDILWKKIRLECSSRPKVVSFHSKKQLRKCKTKGGNTGWMFAKQTITEGSLHCLSAE